MDFRSILTKQHQRDLKILDFFYRNEFIVDELRLQKKFALSTSLMHKNLSRLADCCPGLDFTRNNGNYQMSFTNTLGYDALCRVYLSKTKEVKLMQHLFLEDCQTQTDCADAVFLSVSHTNRILLKIQKMFSDHDIALLNKPMRLTGNERFIRHFYTQFFSETGGPPEALSFIESPQLHTIDTLLTKFLKHHKIPENHYRHTKLLLSMMIGWYRNHHGHQLFENTWQHPYFEDPATFLAAESQTMTADLFSKRDRNRLQLNHADLFWLCYSNCYLLSSEQYHQAIATDSEFCQLKERIARFLYQIVWQQQLSYTEHQLEDLLSRFLQENTAFRTNSDFVRIFRHPTDSFLSRAADFYPYGTSQIKQDLAAFLAKESLKISCQAQDYLLFSLMKELPEIIYGTIALRILVMSDLTDNHDEHMAVKLQQLLGRNVTFETMPAAYLSKDDLNIYLGNFDLIISTFSPNIALKHHPFYLTDPFMNFVTFDQLHHKLQQLRQEKALWKLEDAAFAMAASPAVSASAY